MKKSRILRDVLAAAGILILCLGLFLCWNLYENRSFENTYYNVFSDDIGETVRAVFLSDLHQASFGEDNQELVDEIKRLHPDLILTGGDMINEKDPDISCVVELCRRLTSIAPVYYGMGNHENTVVYGMDLTLQNLEGAGVPAEEEEDFSELIKDESLLTGLEEAGVIVLQNHFVRTEVNGNSIVIGGISTNIDAFWPYSGHFFSDFEAEPDTDFKILLSHFPYPVPRYLDDSSIDLALSGHNHGGIIRIPGIGALFSYEGWFPEYTDGLTYINDIALIVSRGLGGHGWIPRICNKPELVVIDLY